MLEARLRASPGVSFPVRCKRISAVEAPLWSPLNTVCLHTLETRGEKPSCPIYWRSMIKSTFRGEHAGENQEAPSEPAGMWRPGGEQSLPVLSGRPPANLLFRFPSLPVTQLERRGFRGVCTQAGVSLFSHTRLGKPWCLVNCDTFPLLDGLCLLAHSHLRVLRCLRCARLPLEPLSVYL